MKKQTNLVILAVRVILALACAGALACGIYRCGMYQQLGAADEIGPYLSMALVAIVGFGITYIPNFLMQKDILAVPVAVQTAFAVFLFCAIFCGEILHFYDQFAWWDTMLHLVSGLLFSVTGYLLFVSLNRDHSMRSQLHPLTVVLFSFCFARACGAVWEIYEFAGDSFAGLNMQRWQNNIAPEQWAALQNASNLSSPGLMDTMKDIINDTLGAALSIAVLLPMVRRNNRYIKANITTQDLLAAEWPFASPLNTGHPQVQNNHVN